MSRHVDYANWWILVDASMLDPELTGFVPMEIHAITIDEVDPDGCDFCTDRYAVYEVQAEAALGEAGHNTLYCQPCAAVAANSYGHNPDEWINGVDFSRRKCEHGFSIAGRCPVNPDGCMVQ